MRVVRSSVSRCWAVVLALLVAFTAPTAALAHGVAHLRAAHGAHWAHAALGAAADHLAPHAAHGDEQDEHRDDVAAADPDGGHGHALLGAGVQPSRAELADAVRPELVTLPAAVLTTAQPGLTSVFEARLRATPPTGPPPRLRAPPGR